RFGEELLHLITQQIPNRHESPCSGTRALGNLDGGITADDEFRHERRQRGKGQGYTQGLEDETAPIHGVHGARNFSTIDVRSPRPPQAADSRGQWMVAGGIQTWISLGARRKTQLRAKLLFGSGAQESVRSWERQRVAGRSTVCARSYSLLRTPWR